MDMTQEISPPIKLNKLHQTCQETKKEKELKGKNEDENVENFAIITTKHTDRK